MRATILDPVELAVQVVDADGDRAGDDDLDRPRRQLLGGADVEPGQNYFSSSSSRPAHSCGSGVPFARCRAIFKTPTPSSAHWRRTGGTGIPTSSSRTA